MANIYYNRGGILVLFFCLALSFGFYAAFKDMAMFKKLFITDASAGAVLLIVSALSVSLNLVQFEDKAKYPLLVIGAAIVAGTVWLMNGQRYSILQDGKPVSLSQLPDAPKDFLRSHATYKLVLVSLSVLSLIYVVSNTLFTFPKVNSTVIVLTATVLVLGAMMFATRNRNVSSVVQSLLTKSKLTYIAFSVLVTSLVFQFIYMVQRRQPEPDGNYREKTYSDWNWLILMALGIGLYVFHRQRFK